MKKMSAPVIFFGNERIATGVHTQTPILRTLVEHGYNIIAIVANYEHGTSRNARDLEIASVAHERNIPLLLPNKLLDISTELKDFQAAAAVLVAYGKIIPQSVIDIFPKGIVNVHPSLLPKHRGPTPLESVILDGSRNTGVSIMQLAKTMDAGPIYAQAEVTLTGRETKQELADSLLEVSSAMLIEVLPGILSGEVVALPQDDTAATYDTLITKEVGLLDFTKPAEQLEREVRAYLDWPKSRTNIGGKEVIITKARVASRSEESEARSAKKPGTIFVTPEKELAIQTGKALLIIDHLKPAGKPEMTAQAFLAGHPL